MTQIQSVLVIGGTGMLGRPVVRRLIADGFDVRVLARDPLKGRAVLPDAVEVFPGDLRDAEALDEAMRGVDAVHVSLGNPASPTAEFDPERDGTPLVMQAAARAGVQRISRISALGVPAGRDGWWVIERKAAIDDAMLNGDVPATIFRCDWMMESIPALVVGPHLLSPSVPGEGLYWLAGDDLGRQVSAALRSDEARHRAFAAQGPEPVPFKDALKRFRAAYSTGFLPMPVPRPVLKAAGVLVPIAGYFADLLDHTYAYTTGFQAKETWDLLGEPTMSIEDYTRSIAVTRDFPRKVPLL